MLSDIQLSSNLSTPSRLTTSTRSSPRRWQSAPKYNEQYEEKSFSSISSIYGKNSGVEIKTCASLKEMISVRVPAANDQWWCILVRYLFDIFNEFDKKTAIVIIKLVKYICIGILMSRSARFF